jgi:hypothetical protein
MPNHHTLRLHAFESAKPGGVGQALTVNVTAIAFMASGLSNVAADGTQCRLVQVQMRPAGTFLVHEADIDRGVNSLVGQWETRLEALAKPTPEVEVLRLLGDRTRTLSVLEPHGLELPLVEKLIAGERVTVRINGKAWFVVAAGEAE